MQQPLSQSLSQQGCPGDPHATQECVEHRSPGVEHG
jgi:hypothetical protein